MRETSEEMARRLIKDSIWKSANLEGLGTTFSSTEAILTNARTTTKAEEVLFVINMKRAWIFLLEHLEHGNNLMLLQEYNKIVGELLFKPAGEIRTKPVRMGGTSWKPEMPHTDIIMENIDRINQTNDAEMRALKFFCYVARTQMFADGNKRVAQLIANKILIQNNVGIFQIPIEKLGEFRILLLELYKSGRDIEIIEFMREHCIRRAKEIKAML